MKPIIDWIMDHRIHILLAVLLSVAVLVNVGCATAKATAVQPEYVDTSSKVVLGGAANGVVFAIIDHDQPWVCRPDGDENDPTSWYVSCDSGNVRYNCEYQEAPVFFDNCVRTDDEVPPGITTVEPTVNII